ncbi:ATP-binding protein [Streptomyces sp. NPDC095602]|uniref:ATP-binding protein n=1 Tax=Streptomyces sp. NPDC095602 TaxID=3155819 RepID=UPI00332710F6
MRTEWCRAFPGLAGQVAHARHFVAALFTERGPVDDAVLIVSELAANAVRHTLSGSAGGRFLVIVSFGDGLVRIEVVDQCGDCEPRLCDATAQEEGGRGLLLIASCVKDWGVKERPEGRSVWADLEWEGA